MKTPTAERNRQVVEKIKATRLYQTFESAFRDVTGLGLSLQPMHGLETVEAGNAFCKILNRGGACRECQRLSVGLIRSASRSSDTLQCRMGLAESAIPVKFDNETIALLRTGQIRFTKPTRDDLKKLSDQLLAEEFEDADVLRLAEAYGKIDVVDSDTYQHAITMLAIFSLHITTLISQLVLSQGNTEPVLVSRAKQYIAARLGGKLTLAKVSNLTGVSPFYFCKVFKQSTGLTFTEYVNRKRIEWAMRLLKNPRFSITEVAYDVGYQSLSQFNRCFRKIAGQSPSEYRKQEDIKSRPMRKLADAA